MMHDERISLKKLPKQTTETDNSMLVHDQSVNNETMSRLGLIKIRERKLVAQCTYGHR